MASRVTNLQSGSLDYRREGVSVLTKEQQVSTSIVRLRPNSSDLLIYSGKLVSDDFFDENLLDSEISGSITNAPNNFYEMRTLGQGAPTDPTYTEISDFDVIRYIEDDGLALYPVVLTALCFTDPAAEDSTIGIFETRKEIANLRIEPAFARKGVKASSCSTAEGIDRLFYEIKQSLPRKYSEGLGKRGKYVEASDGTDIVSTMTYADQEPSSSRPFVDDYDSTAAFNSGIASLNDQEIFQVLLAGQTPCLVQSRDEISAASGWTFLNNVNGTDSIVYSDRS